MKPCIFIGAGGTGGHIYPALAIAEAFRKSRPDFDIYFVGTKHGLENKIVPPRGFKVLHVPVGRLNQVSALERLRTMCLMPVSLLWSWFLLLKYRPKFVLGAGGYASGPVLLMAGLTGLRTAIWEPNAMPGLTNRILARRVDECLLVFESARGLLKTKNIVNVGMPVRSEIETLNPAPPAHSRSHVLVFGGSQGARAINTAVAEMVKVTKDFVDQHEMVHQTGPSDFQRVSGLYGPIAKSGLEVVEYLHDMPRRYEWADVVIARAGAATVAELAACGKAAILVPLPTAADNHQQKNAEALTSKNAAIMILQKDLTPEKLRATLQELESHPSLSRELASNIRRFHRPQAAEQIASHILSRMT